MEVVQVSYEDWEEQYQPIMKGESLKDFHPKILENKKDQNTLAKAVKENKVWTLVDTDEGLVIMSGFHFVNRIDVYITEKPFKEEIEINYE